jgi:dynein heavy chain
MSPIGDVFRDRLRMFPSLVNCCTIDWFSEWPPEALVSVAAQTLDAVEVSADGVREKLVQVITLSSHLTVAL